MSLFKYLKKAGLPTAEDAGISAKATESLFLNSYNVNRPLLVLEESENATYLSLTKRDPTLGNLPQRMEIKLPLKSLNPAFLIEEKAP